MTNLIICVYLKTEKKISPRAKALDDKKLQDLLINKSKKNILTIQ